MSFEFFVFEMVPDLFISQDTFGQTPREYPPCVKKNNHHLLRKDATP
jgi:hypothetical protein